MKNRLPAKRVATSAIYVLATFAALELTFGPRGYPTGVITSILFLAWQHDNDVGILLPIAMLFVIILLVMFLLIFMMIILHP